MRTSLVVLAMLIRVASPALAHAQSVSLSAPAPPVVAPTVVADPSSAAQDPVSLPLRLTFLNAGGAVQGVPPGGCSGPSVDEAGTILPVQPHLQVQLTLRLTLQAFSNLGCPGDPYAAFDTGVGGGLTYEVPIHPWLSLVASAGAYAQSASATSTTLSTIRKSKTVGVDLMWKAPERTTSVGLGVTTPASGGVRVMPRVGGSF